MMTPRRELGDPCLRTPSPKHPSGSSETRPGYGQVLLLPCHPLRQSSFLGAVGEAQAATTYVMIESTARVRARRDMAGLRGDVITRARNCARR
jgi:hypothetical protein